MSEPAGFHFSTAMFTISESVLQDRGEREILMSRDPVYIVCRDESHYRH
jgi:hypothetical protein